MAIHWPRPEVFFTNGMRSIGYQRRRRAAGGIRGAEVTARWTLEGRLDLGVCLDVCMPVTLDLTGSCCPTRSATATSALRCPTAPDRGGGRRGNGALRVEPISDGLRVTVTADVPPTGNDETLVLEHRDPQIWVSEADDAAGGRHRDGRRGCVPSDHGPFALNRSDLRVTVIGTQMAVELDGCRG
jgi:DsbC/DsbD-like thiol-disulfide interchange protein